MIAPETTDCAVFVTHIWSPRIARHFERLRREAGTVLPVFLAFHQTAPGAPLPEGVSADIVVGDQDGARITPYRYEDHVGRGPLTMSGYVDMIWIAILLNPRLAAFERLWLIEYDVDFSGDWATFFRSADDYEGDLLAAYVRTRSEQPGWAHWSSLVQPEGAPPEPTAAFLPISRYSRRLLETFRAVLSVAGWEGHLEVVLPSVAIAHNMSVAEIGGSGERAPLSRRGKHYWANFANSREPESTHRFPTYGVSYFVDRPRDFRFRDRIYHPIKTELSPDQLADLAPKLKRDRLYRLVPRRLRGLILRMRAPRRA